MNKPTLIIWGAGKIGRGPIADMFHASGWHLVFVRRSAEFIRKMRDAGRYTIMRCEPEKDPQPVIIADPRCCLPDRNCVTAPVRKAA